MVAVQLEEFVIGHRKSVFNGRYVSIYISGDNGQTSAHVNDPKALRRMAQDLMVAADYLEGKNV